MDKFDEIARAQEMLRFQIRRNVVQLFKRFLETVESIGDCHEESLDKLRQNLPKEYQKYINLADYFTPIREEAIRKQILDAGNDCIRSLEEEIKQFEIKLK